MNNINNINNKLNNLNNGFTLVELIVCIIILSILAMTSVSFFKPSVDSYMISRNRANLSEIADISLRNISREVQTAVPSSVRVNVNNSCVEFIPSKSGGVFTATRPPNKSTVNSFATLEENDIGGINQGKKLDILAISPNKNADLTGFDITSKPAKGDFIAIGAMRDAEIFDSTNKSRAVSELDDFVESAAESGIGTLIFKDKPTFSRAYDGNRFHVIDKDKISVVYICETNFDTNTNGSGVLYKKILKNFNGNIADSCNKKDAAVVVDNLSNCVFTYDSQIETASGAYLGYLNVSLGITQNNETINLNKGIHIDNLP